MCFLILFVSFISVSSAGDVSNAVSNLYCELGLKNDNSCPVDGGWTSWSPWSSCSGKCGFRGRRIKHRTCNNPLPSNNGAPCIGSSYQTESCKIAGCTMKDYENIVRDHPIRKEEMKIVKRVHRKLPALIELCFSVDCTFSIVEKILGNNAMHYWNAMNCIKHDVGCPNPGGWSTWGAWSQCSAVCGGGNKYRTRTCNSPVPSTPKLTCSDSAFEKKSCVGFNCKKHSSGTWNDWSEWKPCNVQCGNGIQTRKRSCSEIQNTQETSCKGASKEMRGCTVDNCSINGMWSPWTVWTPCSTSCGIGAQIKNRMCNNPSPSGNGAPCFGSASELRRCFTKPCKVKTHEVVHFTEESNILFAPNGIPLRLLYVYLRFLPLSSFGVLVHRFESDCTGSMCDYVKLSLLNRKIALLSQVAGCILGIVHEDKLEMGEWHVASASICGTHAVLRVDDGPHKVAAFSCVPISYNLDHTTKIGEGFRGQIQQVAINFVPLQLRPSKDKYNEERLNVPVSSNNVQYLMGDDEEGFIYVGLTESVAVPGPKNMQFWQIAISLKAEDINGVIAIIPDDTLNKYILVLLEEGRIKLRFYQEAMYIGTESVEHILIGVWFEVIITQNGKNLYMQIDGNEKKYVPVVAEKLITSATTVFIGAIRDDMREKICFKCTELSQMSFTLGSLILDGNQIDLLSLPVLETTNKRFSSRTISSSDYYEEVSLLLGQELKLSCLYDKSVHDSRDHIFYTKTYVSWFLMDKLLQSYGKDNEFFNLKDDGRVSTISIASYTTRDAIENFYSCHIHHYRNNSFKDSSRILLSFGVTVIDKNKEVEDIFWKKWCFICGATIVWFVLVMLWCTFEMVQDVRTGYSFFRSPSLNNNDNFSSMVNFILSKDGVTLLGCQQVANEIVSQITGDN